MTTAIQGKNLIAVISIVAWSLALFFTVKLASAETKMDHQGSFAGWYETEDALPAIHNHKTEKMMKRSESAYLTTGNDVISSWYQTEDALPSSGTQKSKAMAEKAPAEQQANKFEGPNLYSWYDTEDALPKI